MAHRLVIQRKGRRPQIFRLLQASVVIGRGQGTDLLLPDVSVSRQHARVVESPDSGHRIIDMESQNGTKVNGQRVTDHPLSDGDELQIGKFLLIYETKPARSVESADAISNYSLEDERTGFLRAVSTTEGETAHQTSALSREQLDAMRNQIQRETGAAVVHRGTGTAHPIGTGGVDFGKGGIPIDGAGFGGAARIAWNGSAHTIEKTGGVLFSVAVNGRKVTEARTLEPGDVIELGKSHFTYQVQ